MKKINQGKPVIHIKPGESYKTNPNFNQKDKDRTEELKKLIPQPGIDTSKMKNNPSK